MRQMRDIDARKVTTMHCGGTIARLYEPETPAELRDLIAAQADFILLGGGSNIIFGDGTITLPVVRLAAPFDQVNIEDLHLQAGAATPLGVLLARAREAGLSGLEFLCGIPGTLGGALWMNAGSATRGIMDVVESIEVVDATGVHTLTRAELPCAYRSGGIPRGSVIIGASLALERTTPETVAERMAACRQQRRALPTGYSSGCIFKNPAGATAGRLIDQAGLKGCAVGGARVSHAHANFIINDGRATCGDIRALILQIKEHVRSRFGIELTEEVLIVD